MSAYSSMERLTSISSETSYGLSSSGTKSSGTFQWREDQPDNLARTLFSRSSRLLLRRKGSRARSLEWLEDSSRQNSKHVQEISTRRRSKHSRAESAGYEMMLKQSISNPYNFQHLTHTGSQHAKALRSASHNDLVTEFSAIRASQAPRSELKGIKANYLPSRSHSVASLLDCPHITPPTSPTQSRDQWSVPLQASHNRSLGSSKSTDSFTRVASRSFSSPTPPLSPPPRTSSRMATTSFVHHRSPVQGSPIATEFVTRTTETTQPQFLPTYSDEADIAGSHSTLSNIAQAVTTLGDTACTLGPYPLNSPPIGLADVPEEDEGFPWSHVSANYSRPNSTIRHAKSLPAVEFSSSRTSRSSDWISQGQSTPEEWGAASDPTLPVFDILQEDIPFRPRMSQRLSTSARGMEASWEDDIDYCYEHAAEADCAFEWDKASNVDENVFDNNPAFDNATYGLEAGEDTGDVDRPKPLKKSMFRSGVRLPTHLKTSQLPLPDLDGSSSSSVASSAVTVPGIVTPVEPALSRGIPLRTSPRAVVFPLSPSLLVPQEYTTRVTHEETFQQKLSEAEPLKHHEAYYQTYYNHVLGTDVRRDYSPRSSGSPLSKSNSQESIPASRLPSQDRRHAYGGSAGSLPELVHSRVSREKHTLFNSEQLANQIASPNVAENPQQLSVIIEAFRQDLLREVSLAESIAEEAEESFISSSQLPHQRSNSNSANLILNPSTKGTGPGHTRRMRSESAATSLSGKSISSRASYSLFPQVSTR